MENRETTLDRYGNAILTVEEGRQAILNGHLLDNAFFSDAVSVRVFNQYAERVLGRSVSLRSPILDNIDPETYHTTRAEQWNIPEEFKELDIRALLLGLCSTDKETARVEMELNMYEERNLLPLLRFLVFLVDHMREHDIVWGVGRGSSVASYCLYLLGVHKIDSIKYELPIEEFLK